MLQSLQNVLKNKDNVVVMGSAIVVCLIGVFIGNNLHNHNDDSDTGSGSDGAKPEVVSEIIKDENDSPDSGETDKKIDSLNDDTEKKSDSTDNLQLEINDITGDDKPDITSVDSSDINSDDKPDITSDSTDVTSDDTNINKTNDESTTAKGVDLPEQSQTILPNELSTTSTDDSNTMSMDDLINNNSPQESSNPFDTNSGETQSNPPVSSSVSTEPVDDNTAEKKPVVLEETGGKNRSKKHRKNKKSKKSRKHHK